MMAVSLLTAPCSAALARRARIDGSVRAPVPAATVERKNRRRPSRANVGAGGRGSTNVSSSSRLARMSVAFRSAKECAFAERKATMHIKNHPPYLFSVSPYPLSKQLVDRLAVGQQRHRASLEIDGLQAGVDAQVPVERRQHVAGTDRPVDGDGAA